MLISTGRVSIPNGARRARLAASGAVTPKFPDRQDALMRSNQIQHVFVLMLEFSGLTGTDASTGASTKINGLIGTELNTYNGQTFSVSPGAPDRMPADPGHEFSNVLLQLCGQGASYPSGGAYPVINNSGYVASYAD